MDCTQILGLDASVSPTGWISMPRPSVYPCPKCGEAYTAHIFADKKRHTDAVVRRWTSGLTNARLEGMNNLFKAAWSRARGYRSETNFIAMIYLVGSPVGRLFD